MKRCLISLSIFVLPTIIWGQQLPTIIPPSPQSQEFVKYIDFPMDLSSGLPTIDIPIYSIKLKELNIPISISYHASGLKPNTDESGIIGLGWHLNAGGIITRSINKYPDEQVWNSIIPQENNFTSTTNPYVGDSDANTLDLLVRGYKESEPDVFSYNFPNASGKFIFKRSTVLSEFLNPVLLPFKPVKITPHLQTRITNMAFDNFEVVDENGVFYRFGKSISSGNDEIEKYCNINNSSESGNSSWLLTDIISADKSDTVSFVYDDVMCHSMSGNTLTNQLQKSHRIFNNTTNNVENSANWPNQSHGGPSASFTAYGYTQKKIIKIKFKLGEVKFIYKSNLYPNQLLDRVEIYSKTSSLPLQTIKLKQTKYHNTPGLLNWNKLDELEYYDSNNTKINKYTFFYDQSIKFPTINDTQTTNETYSVDFWGFYNGARNTNGTLPSFNSNNLFGIADRNANPTYAKAGILNTIIYPTGGIDVLEYEGNYAIGAIGGVRVKKVTHTADGREIKRSFTYGGMSFPISMDFFMNQLIYIQQSGLKIPTNLIINSIITSSDPKIDISVDGRPVLYGLVTEYDGDLDTNNGRIEHKFDDSFLKTSVNYQHSFVDRGYPWNTRFGVEVPVCHRDLVFGNLFEKETSIYDNLGNPIKQTFNYYSHNLNERLNGFSSTKSVDVSIVDFAPLPLKGKVYFYNFFNYNIDQLSQKLDSTVTINYMSGIPVKTREKYSYNANLLVTNKEIQMSNGNWRTTNYAYPNDFMEQSPYSDMVNNRHILSPVIEKKELLGISPLQFTKTNYFDWGNNIIAPISVEIKNATNSYETQASFNAYDKKGNLTDVNKTGDRHTLYLWSYNGQYPVAKIEGLTYVQLLNYYPQTSVDNLLNTANPTFEQVKSIQKEIAGEQVLVTTYTYEPLVGVKTITDPRGVTTYYEYDNFDRLKRTYIKEFNSAGREQERVIQRYDYHYQNQ